MPVSGSNIMEVEAELRAPVAAAQLVKFRFAEPPDSVLRADSKWRLDWCLTPRPKNARACYADRWGSDRFEPLGKIFVVPPGERPHVCSDTTGEQMSLLCQLDQTVLGDVGEAALPWRDEQLASGLDLRNNVIQTLLARLAQEARHPGFASEVLVELIASQLAIELVRHQQKVVPPSLKGGLAAWRLQKIDERLRELPVMPSLAELALLCGISVRQLTRGFKVSRGVSIGQYVAESRIAHARRMLGTGRSIKATAYELGFASPSSFCYAFRRATGQTPGEYRDSLVTLH